VDLRILMKFIYDRPIGTGDAVIFTPRRLLRVAKQIRAADMMVVVISARRIVSLPLVSCSPLSS